MVPICQIFNRYDLSSAFFVSLTMANECEEPFFWLMDLATGVLIHQKDLRSGSDQRTWGCICLHSSHQHRTTKRLASGCGIRVSHKHIVIYLRDLYAPRQLELVIMNEYNTYSYLYLQHVVWRICANFPAIFDKWQCTQTKNVCKGTPHCPQTSDDIN